MFGYGSNDYLFDSYESNFYDFYKPRRTRRTTGLTRPKSEDMLGNLLK